MRKLMSWLTVGLIASLMFCGSAKAEPTNLNEQVVNETGLAVAKTVLIDTNRMGGAKISAQVISSTSNISTVTAYDGIKSTMQITVASIVGLSSAPASTTITVSSNTALAPAYASTLLALTSNYLGYGTTTWTQRSFSINGSTYTEGVEWKSNATYSTNTIASIMSALDNRKPSGISYQIVSSTGISFKSTTAGTSGNKYTLVSSSNASLTPSTTMFIGGTDQARASFCLNGTTFTENQQWGMQSTASGTATSIAYAIQKTSFTNGFNATAVGSVVYSTPVALSVSSMGIISWSQLYGIIGNKYTITTSTPTALLSSGTFSGGRDSAKIEITNNAQAVFINGRDWATGGNTSQTAQAISNAFMANSSIAAIMQSTWSASVIYCTSTWINDKILIFTSTQAALSLSATDYWSVDSSTASGLFRGYGTDISTKTDTVLKANSFSVGLPVLYSTVGAGAVTGLASKTTYYIALPTASSFKLARTSTGAVSATTFGTTYQSLYSTSVPVGSTASIVSLGSYNVGASSGGTVYTFAPLANVGVTSMTWYSSNDGANFNSVGNAITISSQTAFSSSTLVDFGAYDYRWLKLYISTPTLGGGTDTKVWINGKN